MNCTRNLNCHRLHRIRILREVADALLKYILELIETKMPVFNMTVIAKARKLCPGLKVQSAQTSSVVGWLHKWSLVFLLRTHESQSAHAKIAVETKEYISYDRK